MTIEQTSIIVLAVIIGILAGFVRGLIYKVEYSRRSIEQFEAGFEFLMNKLREFEEKDKPDGTD